MIVSLPPGVTPQEETFLLVELTSDDQLSELFLSLYFPFEPGDRCIRKDFAHSQVILKIARSKLTPQQEFLLQTTPAIVGYAALSRAEYEQRLRQSKEGGWNGK